MWQEAREQLRAQMRIAERHAAAEPFCGGLHGTAPARGQVMAAASCGGVGIRPGDQIVFGGGGRIRTVSGIAYLLREDIKAVEAPRQLGRVDHNKNVRFSAERVTECGFDGRGDLTCTPATDGRAGPALRH